MLTALIALNVTGYMAYTAMPGDENEKCIASKYFEHDELVLIIISLIVVTAVLYIHISAKAQFNVAGLWMAIPLLLLGGYLVISTHIKLGKKGTFFGREYKIYAEELTGFPFSIGHAQYKGCIIMLLGWWCAFKHTHELTGMTGLWIISIMIQMTVETPPGMTVPTPKPQEN